MMTSTVNACAALCLVAGTALVSFWPSLNADFAFDDAEAIVSNPDVVAQRKWHDVFANDFWGSRLTSNTSHKSYRPLTVLTFRLNFVMAGYELLPRMFHATNLALHVVCCLVMLMAYDRLVRRKRHGHGRHRPATGIFFTRVSLVSLFAALLFAAHPVHTENVAGVVGRADILCTICFFIAFFAYDKGLRFHRYATLTSTALFITSAVFAAIGMLFKEQGVTALGFCFAFDLLTTANKWRWKLFLHRSIFLFCSASITLAFRWWIMGAANPHFQSVDNPGSFAETWWQRAANYNYVYAINAWILLNPLWLCYDWSMGCVPLIESLADVRLLAVVILWTIVVVLSAHCRKRDAAVAMSLSLVAVSFVPASNLLFRVGFVVAERVLFLPSTGFCLLVAIGYGRLLNLFVKYRSVVNSLGVACLMLFSFRSRQRCLDWMSEVNLFQSGLSVCPLNAKVHYNIAKKAADVGNQTAAIEEYMEALRLFPRYDQAMNNLANIFRDKGQLIEAEDLLSSAIMIRPEFAAAWMNLGIVQTSLRKYDLAERSYLMALTHRKFYPDCYYNLGNLYLDQRRFDDAYHAWINATLQKPTHLVSWNNLIIMLDNRGDYEKAKWIAKEALGLLPHESSIHFNMANVLGKLGEYSQSEEHFMTAIRLSPHNPSYFTNLGVLYHRWRRYDQAEEAYRRALLLDSSAQSAKDNLASLLETRPKSQIS